MIGHSEGAAGLAGLLKAMLVIQHDVIPPNLHFKALNLELQPFYHNLEALVERISWPETRDGIRRASVNCFGFGGTNVHVILENYTRGIRTLPIKDACGQVALPFSFSASFSRGFVVQVFVLSQHKSHYRPERPRMDLLYFGVDSRTETKVIALSESLASRTTPSC